MFLLIFICSKKNLFATSLGISLVKIIQIQYQCDFKGQTIQVLLIRQIINLMSSSSKFIVLNKYQIDYSQMLGKGAMGKVYLGFYKPGESNKDTMFAVKQIPAKQIPTNSSTIAADALLQQINLLRKITHPYILKYIDAKKTQNSLFLFLEYCNKGTLQDFVEYHPEGLSEQMIKRFIAQMVIALKFLKARNIIHRDIKPKNILINDEGIKISDFGVAKIINNHNSDQQTTTFSGTIQFMSPQILKQQKYTFQTDVWSLGITIYWLLFQRLPWNSQKVMGILKEIGEEVVIPETSISVLLRDLLQKMLIIDENDRITIEQVAEHCYLKEQIKILEAEIAEEQVSYESKEITKTEFMLNSLVTSDISQVQLERRSIEVKKGVRASHFTKDLARQAYRKLNNHKENILFFKDNLDYLRTCNHKKKIIPEGMFRKCQFLLVKRCYTIAKDLQQIFSFSIHVQGNIIIPKNQFLELIEGRNIYSKTLRSEVDRLYEEFKDEWLRTKESFYSYQRKEGIRLRPREDAYLQHLIQSKSLILAFNDCFLDLFFYFSHSLVDNYAKNFSQEIASSTILLQLGVKIEFIYDIMIILCFPNISEGGTIKHYRDKKKRVPCQEYLYRISIAYREWKPSWQPLDEAVRAHLAIQQQPLL